MTLRGQAWGNDAQTYDGADMRHLVASFAAPGVVGPDDFLVTEQTVPDDTLKVAGGLLVVEADGAGLFGRYLVPNEGDDTTPGFTPTGGDGRIDELICRVTAGVPALEIVEGVASGSPVAPTITGDNWEWLATVTIPATTSVITDAFVTDRRRMATRSLVSVATTADLPAGSVTGQRAHVEDIGVDVTWTGALWAPTGSGVLTSYTPTLGQPTTVAKTVTYAKWVRQGGLIRVKFRLIATGGGVAGNPITVSLPFTAVVHSACGAGHILDSGSTMHVGDWQNSQGGGSATVVSMLTEGSSGAGVGANPAQTLANNDQVVGDVTFEPA